MGGTIATHLRPKVGRCHPDQGGSVQLKVGRTHLELRGGARALKVGLRTTRARTGGRCLQ